MAHVPIYAGLTQAITIANVLLRRYTIRTTRISLRAIKPAKVRQGSKRTVSSLLSAVHTPIHGNGRYCYPQSLILRSFQDTILSQAIGLCTSVLTFGLYAFGTTVLAGMTMFPASDTVRVMVLIVVSAGVGRVIGNWITASSGRWRETFVVDVPLAYHEWIAERVTEQSR